MKVILKENQLGTIFSKLSRTSFNPSLLQKFMTLIGNDQTIELVILKAINDGNISDVNHKTSSPTFFLLSDKIEFNVGHIPVIIYESYDYNGALNKDYSIKIPIIDMERTNISKRIGEKIWNKLLKLEK